MRSYTASTKTVVHQQQASPATVGSGRIHRNTVDGSRGRTAELLSLQHCLGNHFLQRALLVPGSATDTKALQRQPAQSERQGTASGAPLSAEPGEALKPLYEALQTFLAAVGGSGKGMAGAAKLAEQAAPGQSAAENKLKDTLQTALALEKELRARHANYGEKGGFQGYGEDRAKDQYVCTTFAEEVLRRAGYKLTGVVKGQINIAIDWERELGKEKPSKEEKQAALARLVKEGDPRTKGVVNALISSKQGTEVTIEQLRPGDFVQYWSSLTSGHVVQVADVVSPGIIIAHGSHLSTRGVTTVKVDLRKKTRVDCVRPIGSKAGNVAPVTATTPAPAPTLVGTTESPAALNAAAKNNATMGAKLGWLPQLDAIVRHFQSLGFLPPLQTPDEEGFASAVKQYQSQNPPLAQDGVLGPTTWRRLKNQIQQPAMPAGPSRTPAAPAVPKDGGRRAIPLKGLKGLERSMAKIANEYGDFLAQQANALGIDVADAAGFLQVESGGRGVAADTGRMIIRFENHVFYDLWGKRNRAQFDPHFKFSAKKRWQGHLFRADPKGDFETMHTSQAREWEVLEFARKLDEEAALRSISMGLAQILGSNYKTLGYSSAKEMFDAMSGSLQIQAQGLFTFIAKDRGGAIVKALQEKNYTLAARYYNGSGQQELYGSRLKAASEAYARVVKQHTETKP